MSGLTEEAFNWSYYEMLLVEDRKMIDEYISKMTSGDVNSFMKRLIEHYKTEEALEVDEEQDSIVVFELNKALSQTNNASLVNFIDGFISLTKTADDINTFFSHKENFDFVLENPNFYKNNSPAFTHIKKHFHLKKSLKSLLDDQQELIGFIWEGVNTYFHNKNTNRSPFYPYIGTIVNRSIRKNLDVGFMCPYCSSYYTRPMDKKDLISCSNCKNKFVFAGVKCPNTNCGKIVSLSSIDKKIFDKNNIKHIRALASLSDYINKESIQYLVKSLGLPVNEVLDGYKIPISFDLKKQKIDKMAEYSLGKDTMTNVSPYLFYLPLVCPITTGQTYSRPTKKNMFKGCGSKFNILDGLRKIQHDGYNVYNIHDQHRVRFINYNKKDLSYDDMLVTSNEHNYSHVNIKLPYDRIIKYFNSYFSSLKKSKNKTTEYLSIAINKYFEEEYLDALNKLISIGDAMSQKDKLYVCNFDKYLNDTNLQNKLFYDNSDDNHRVGWIPNRDAKDRIREIYIEIAQTEDEQIRKINNAKLPIRFYTYRIDKLHDRISYKKRIGIAIDKSVLPATPRATAGYGQNFKMDTKFLQVQLVGDKYLDLSTYVKSAGYWFQENASLHNFDNKTGIIWFDGTEIDKNQWQFPDGVVIDDKSDAIVSTICTSDAFSKMFQRFDFNNKLRELVLQLESESII